MHGERGSLGLTLCRCRGQMQAECELRSSRILHRVNRGEQNSVTARRDVFAQTFSPSETEQSKESDKPSVPRRSQSTMRLWRAMKNPTSKQKKTSVMGDTVQIKTDTPVTCLFIGVCRSTRITPVWWFPEHLLSSTERQ